MTTDVDHDLIIVGAGISGLIAANRVAKLGRKPIVLEKGQDELYLCNSRFTGGFFHIGFEDMHQPPDVLRAIIKRVMRGQERDDLADAMAGDAARAIRWLRDNGA